MIVPDVLLACGIFCAESFASLRFLTRTNHPYFRQSYLSGSIHDYSECLVSLRVAGNDSLSTQTPVANDRVLLVVRKTNIRRVGQARKADTCAQHQGATQGSQQGIGARIAEPVLSEGGLCLATGNEGRLLRGLEAAGAGADWQVSVCGTIGESRRVNERTGRVPGEPWSASWSTEKDTFCEQPGLTPGTLLRHSAAESPGSTLRHRRRSCGMPPTTMAKPRRWILTAA